MPETIPKKKIILRKKREIRHGDNPSLYIEQFLVPWGSEMGKNKVAEWVKG